MIHQSVSKYVSSKSKHRYDGWMKTGEMVSQCAYCLKHDDGRLFMMQVQKICSGVNGGQLVVDLVLAVLPRVLYMFR